MRENPIDVMLSEAKHLAFSFTYEDEILRLSPQDDIATQSLTGEERPTKSLLLFLALIMLTLLSMGVGGFVQTGSAAEGTRFLASYGGTAGYQLPLWVNKELGFSKKHGVDLEIILIQAGSPNIQALLGGSLQLTQTAASSAVIGAARGAPVVIVATLENKLPMLLVSRPEIKEPQQLRGKVIGINRFGGSNDAAVLMAVKAWKMDPKDISMLQTGGTAARMAALLSKKVDATVQSYPEIFQARKLGMNVLADIGDFGFYTNTSNIVTRSYLQQNRAAVKGFIKGQIEGMHYVKTNKEGSLRILRKHLQVTDPEAVEGTYEFFAKRLPRSPRTELEGIKNILVSIDAGDKTPADFIDMSLVDEIEREGFVKKLYGS
ncbi:MAG: ABC transporter substrate-binding protein [Deltaproteobacteria bacterium]|nr:ABC transporter substrate-binding protein [Deltaproteobacteria bacterium]MBI3064232.1 ABC transporter substrate-binding protein [Deltaproteobacteria bacterium]